MQRENRENREILQHITHRANKLRLTHSKEEVGKFESLTRNYSNRNIAEDYDRHARFLCIHFSKDPSHLTFNVPVTKTSSRL